MRWCREQRFRLIVGLLDLADLLRCVQQGLLEVAKSSTRTASRQVSSGGRRRAKAGSGLPQVGGGASGQCRAAYRRQEVRHLHVRDGEMLRAVLPYTAKVFGRAILMVVGPADGDAVGHGRLFGRWSSSHRIRNQAMPARLGRNSGRRPAARAPSGCHGGRSGWSETRAFHPQRLPARLQRCPPMAHYRVTRASDRRVDVANETGRACK